MAHTPGDNDQALKFIASLNDGQREKILLQFDDDLKTSWHFLPAASWPREGIQIKALDDHQQELLFSLLKTFLSESGYMKVQKIIDFESVLAEIQGRPEYRDPDKYHVTFYGNPKTDNIWAWSFEGHHLSLNFTVTDNNISVTPRFMGSNPATILSGPRKGERILDREEDLGFHLINSLSESQKARAIFQSSSPRGIVTGNSERIDPLSPVGIKMADLNDQQQDILMQLIWEYISSVPTELAEDRTKKLKAEEFNEIMFGWAGALEPGKPHYYRIQGKSFLIEFDNTQNNANHIHTVWRDFAGDFGRDLIKEHYQNAQHTNHQHHSH